MSDCETGCDCNACVPRKVIVIPTPHDINKYLAERMEMCWHELSNPTACALVCKTCNIQQELKGFDVLGGFEAEHSNPNYHTPSGFFKLLEYMKGRGDYWGFIDWLMPELGIARYTSRRMIAAKILFFSQDYKNGPTLCYQYFIGKENDK